MPNHWIAAALLAGALVGGCSEADRAQMGKEANQGRQTAGKAVESTLDTAKLKSALMASNKLDASHIDVDKEKDTYYLRGSVPDAEEKQRAFRLASDMVASNEKVVDELKVQPAAK